eukprot:GHVU01133572.1.p2 GENE.GHVU01133572.1~~GHVU01133572.1.p2  ORF type:complete len:105 (-),score=10.99 GHVU01133572.1:403-717(-)
MNDRDRYVWIGSAPRASVSDSINFAACAAEYELVNLKKRLDICRIRNSILALSSQWMDVTFEAIQWVSETSKKRDIPPKDLLPEEAARRIVAEMREEHMSRMRR